MYIKRHIMRKAASLILISALFSSLANAECIDWGRLMTKYEVDNTLKWKKTILLESFKDFTKQPGDDWLSFGIPRLISEYLASGTEITAIHGAAAKYSPSAKPDFTITGMFQRTEGKLRIFVKLSEGSSLKRQWQLDIPYPDNKQFFDALADTTCSIFEETSPPYDKGVLKSLKNATASVPAFENYIRGTMLYQSFDPDKMDVAKTWFEESKKMDVHYRNAYKGLVDLYAFLAMHNKQNRKAYSGYLESVQGQILDMGRFSQRPPVPERPKRYAIKLDNKQGELTNRFLIANSLFVTGLNASGQKQWLEAARYFEEALFYTPEDAIMWNHLAKIRERTGDTYKAREAYSRAAELNKCLK